MENGPPTRLGGVKETIRNYRSKVAGLPSMGYGKRARNMIDRFQIVGDRSTGKTTVSYIVARAREGGHGVRYLIAAAGDQLIETTECVCVWLWEGSTVAAPNKEINRYIDYCCVCVCCWNKKKEMRAGERRQCGEGGDWKGEGNRLERICTSVQGRRKIEQKRQQE